MSVTKTVLVTGATGKQGGALISALLSNPGPNPFRIIALTRNSQSRSAQALAKKQNISVLEGDLDDVPSIFKKIDHPLHGVFSVQVPLKPAVEEKQGKDLVDAAAAAGVKHFIYTSADRGGPRKSETDPSPIPHFASKFNIEQHLKHVASTTPVMLWSIIRPVAFMDNLTPDFLGKAFMSLWELNGMDTKLQLVSSRDVGILAAEMFKAPEEYAAASISLATDELTPRQAHTIFKETIGTEMPTTYAFVARLLKRVLHEQLGIMFDWFKSNGFGADPRAYITRYSSMQDFRTWLDQSSKFKSS